MTPAPELWQLFAFAGAALLCTFTGGVCGWVLRRDEDARRRWDADVDRHRAREGRE